MMEDSQQQRPTSIRLSTLSPHTRSYVSKYDSDNDGAISVDEALNNLIKVQQESNSYKKKLYALIPTFLVLLACMFGVTIGAIHLTKDLYVKNDVLSTSSGTPVKVAQQTYTDNIYMSLFRTIEHSSKLDNLLLGDVSIPVNGIHQSEANKTITVISVDGYLTLDSNFTLKAFPFKHLENEPSIQAKYSQLSSICSTLNDAFNSLSTNTKIVSQDTSDQTMSDDPQFIEWVENPFDKVPYVAGGGNGYGVICWSAYNCTTALGASPAPPPPPPPMLTTGSHGGD